MKIYTEQDIKNFERDEYERLICPSGDYTGISSFGEYCSFSDHCIFDEYCSFGKTSSFGENCIFGKHCSFGECCSFGESCSFGTVCSFGEYCYFSKWCLFEEKCSFGQNCTFDKHCNFDKHCSFGANCLFNKGCSFDKDCTFGDYCNLENNLYFEDIPEQIDRVIKIDRIGSRKGCTYFFKTLSQIYVRCGCFFGTIEKFEAEVNETHKNHDKYRKEYLEAIKYIKAVI